jgi:hypothetical protein
VCTVWCGAPFPPRFAAVVAPEARVTIGNCVLLRFPSFSTLSGDPYAVDAVGPRVVEVLVSFTPDLLLCRDCVVASQSICAAVADPNVPLQSC